MIAKMQMGPVIKYILCDDFIDVCFRFDVNKNLWMLALARDVHAIRFIEKR